MFKSNISNSKIVVHSRSTERMEQGVFNWKPYAIIVAILLGFGMTVLAMARLMGFV